MAINRLKEVDIVDKALILQAVIAKAGGRIDRHHLQDLIFIAQETGKLPNIFVYDRDRTLGTLVWSSDVDRALDYAQEVGLIGGYDGGRALTLIIYK